jgi:dolichol kinase
MISCSLLPNRTPQTVLCGTLALGIGDALASTVGKRIGTMKWQNRRKSVQGTIAFLLGLFVAFKVLDMIFQSSSDNLSLLWSCTLSALLEAFSEQNDNIVIPLYLFTLLNLK